MAPIRKKIFTFDHNLHLVNDYVLSGPCAIFAFGSSVDTAQRVERSNFKDQARPDIMLDIRRSLCESSAFFFRFLLKLAYVDTN
jgi:hypothetical protein